MTGPFTATAAKAGSWWEITIEGLPDTVLGVSQARRFAEVESTARSLIAELLDIDPETVTVSVDRSPTT
jgi:hypothetical protein